MATRFLTIIFLVLISYSLVNSQDFPECFDELDCEEGYCCISDIVGVEGRCYPCNWTVKSTQVQDELAECHPTMNPCEVLESIIKILNGFQGFNLYF